MGGIFGVASKQDCVTDLYFGVDYHTHLGARRGGMAVYSSENGIQRAIHNIENAPFRTKFGDDLNTMSGEMGIGCISDTDPQPVLVRSHLGSYALTTVGKINNLDKLVDEIIGKGGHFNVQSGSIINPTELVAALIDQCDSITEGIRYAQTRIEGSMSMLLLNKDGVYAARDWMGRTPIILGHKDGAYCAAFESFSYMNLGYRYVRDLKPGEVVLFTADTCKQVMPPNTKMKICAFLWIYYGYTTSCYEGVNVEVMRNECGALLAKRDKGIDVDYVAGIPESGNGHAIG